MAGVLSKAAATYPLGAALYEERRPMKSRILSLPHVFRWVVLLVTGLAAVNSAWALGGGVTYTPISQPINGPVPNVFTYDLTVTAPKTGVTFPITVPLEKTAKLFALGDAATAESYLSFSAPSLKFENAGESQTVTVTIRFPVTALSSNVPDGSYTYLVKTSGWPLGIPNSGATIDASLQLPTNLPKNKPTVVIDSPVDGSSFSVSSFPTTINFSFHASTDANSPTITKVEGFSGQVLTNMKLVPTSTGALGVANVSGTGSLTVQAAGTYFLQVKATNDIGTSCDTKTYTFTVAADAPRNVGGTVFFDMDSDGRMDGCDYGLRGVTIRLFDLCGRVVDTEQTDAAGAYTFAAVKTGRYTVVAECSCGLVPTTPFVRCISVSATDVKVESFGYNLNFLALMLMKADGNSHGFWKTNIDKALDGKTKGVQVSADALRRYTSSLGDFASSSFDGLTMQGALGTLSSNSSRPADLLAKQLIAAEYNYQNGAYLNGNATLTYAFVAWGEHVLENTDDYSCFYVLWAKDWFDAYNNTHGGCVGIPGF